MRFSLGQWPTPLEPMPRLAAALGLGADDLWLKRDDLSGLGGGGNKVRKLEHLIGEALERGADTVITSGAAQSNHARLTAAAAARAGLSAVLVLRGHEPEHSTGNLILDELFGAEIVWSGDGDLNERVAAEAEQRGPRAMVIPLGGSNTIGAQGYVSAGEELLQQLPDLDLVVTAAGSGGTMAGLVQALGAQRVLGIDVGALPDLETAVQSMLPEPATLQIRGDQIGSGYPSFTPAAREALSLAARTEGVVLDPVYTGRAAAGLIAAVTDGSIQPGQRVVLLHSGGLPGLFGHPEIS
ncbi:pyridoxal-phosphate dependent enzyme [Kineosporia rhizophila]|uniref:1-aminocyclopropane-1-carboxylate deaminase/D-cysteine desulfhydrase n=1 Tax=Kineosporia rhizophila TaxID=84633 RepID=UPI001E560E4C|nr:pyridoxal-phosphate dependent enzyme [Kineosporia rhizophila]MCE0540486.1 pyridoxal-phosphate dependent enzyme [Kineosporia rhizophila]